MQEATNPHKELVNTTYSRISNIWILEQLQEKANGNQPIHVFI